MKPEAVTGKTIREWAPLVVALLGAGVVWGTTNAALADLSQRVATLEDGRAGEAQWRQRIDQRLIAIHCHLEPGRCLEGR